MCFGMQLETLLDYNIKWCKRYWNHIKNVLQEARDTAKGDLFGDPDDNVWYAYAIARAIQKMNHTINLIFTNKCTTMKTVNAIMLKEEMERKKAAKLSVGWDVGIV